MPGLAQINHCDVNNESWMRVKSFGHGQLKGHLLRGSEINKDLVIAELTIAYQQPTLYHDFGCLHFYSYIVDILVRIGATWSARS